MTTKRRIFLQDVDSGEPSWYCGESTEEAAEAVKRYLEGTIGELLNPNGDRGVELRLEVMEMTDKEVADLPEF